MCVCIISRKTKIICIAHLMVSVLNFLYIHSLFLIIIEEFLIFTIITIKHTNFQRQGLVYKISNSNY